MGIPFPQPDFVGGTPPHNNSPVDTVYDATASIITFRQVAPCYLPVKTDGLCPTGTRASSAGTHYTADLCAHKSPTLLAAN